MEHLEHNSRSFLAEGKLSQRDESTKFQGLRSMLAFGQLFEDCLSMHCGDSMFGFPSNLEALNDDQMSHRST